MHTKLLNLLCAYVCPIDLFFLFTHTHTHTYSCTLMVQFLSCKHGDLLSFYSLSSSLSHAGVMFFDLYSPYDVYTHTRMHAYIYIYVCVCVCDGEMQLDVTTERNENERKKKASTSISGSSSALNKKDE
jgi:hypothetical protein